jgi:hypothetical protein
MAAIVSSPAVLEYPQPVFLAVFSWPPCRECYFGMFKARNSSAFVPRPVAQMANGPSYSPARVRLTGVRKVASTEAIASSLRPS